MKKQLIYITLIFMVAITLVMLTCSKKQKEFSYEDTYEQQLVDLNEIVRLSEKNDGESAKKLEQAIADFKDKLADTQEKGNERNAVKQLWLIYGLCMIFLILIVTYVYKAILLPFDKLQNYADEIAKGNFDVDLRYERTNYFGKFTWAFDHMRKEITKARSCEKEAIDNNKTVIATLSHDIKTPISSIRAYAEGLDANLDSGPEMRRKYSSVIMKKCDEVTKLTNDLFLHSLSDLDKLKMNEERVNIRELLDKILAELQLKDELVIRIGQIPDVIVDIDTKRFEQVIENLINNANKYAPGSKVEISLIKEEEMLCIYVRDYGSGIPDEDIPFIFDKFYRGRNVFEEQGSGLGLYIVKYIMEQMKGSVSLKSSSEGLKVILKLPYCS